MSKLWLIIKREYLTRVKKRSFILTTLLTPLAFALFFVVIIFIFRGSSDEQKILVKDDMELLEQTMVIRNTKQANFKIDKSSSLDQLLENYKEDGYDGVLHIPVLKRIDQPRGITYYSDAQLGIVTKEFLQTQLAKRVRELNIKELNYDKAIIKKINSINVELREKSPSGEKEDKEGSAELATMMGGAMGFAIYIILFVYGTMVMRSVMEEKTNRIVEVIISSVKPFQLMLGKIIGVGFVGLTQIGIWLILIPGLYFLVFLLFGSYIDPEQMSSMNQGASSVDPDEMQFMVESVVDNLKQQNWLLIIPMFIFYFLGGYFLYSSLFAAIGSAVGDDMGESQSLTLPITIPVVLAIYIMFAVIQNPSSSMATWSSIVPFFSPIVMPARIPFDPPLWEVLLSMVTLLASAIFFVWLSGRIYRIGILMYGKRITFKEISKWIFYKN